MEKPIEIKDNIRIKGKSWGIIFNTIIDKIKLYEYYIKSIKPCKNYSLSIFISHDTVYSTRPNTTVLIDFGTTIDRRDYTVFCYESILPSIRKINDDNFRNILNEISNDTDIYPSYKHKDILFEFLGSEETIKNNICIGCKRSKYGYEFSSNGIICQVCMEISPSDVEIKRKAVVTKLNEVDPTHSMRQFMDLYMSYRDSAVENRMRSYELTIKKYQEHLLMLSKFMMNTKNLLNRELYNQIYNTSISSENPCIGILLVNLGSVEKYRKAGMVRMDQKLNTENKIMIILEFTEDKDQFIKKLHKTYETFDEFKIEYNIFKPTHSMAALDCFQEYITPIIKSNKDIYKIKYDIFDNNYNFLLVIDQFKLNTIRCLID